MEGPEHVGLIAGKTVEPVQHALDERRADLANDAVVLKRFARNIQGQVLGIDQPSEEAQVLGHQLTALALHQHALGAKIQTVLEPRKAQALEVARRAVDHGTELHRRIHCQMKMPERLFLDVVGQVLVKPQVLLFGHLVLGLNPDRLLVVDNLSVGTQADRIGDEARIALDDILDPPIPGEIVSVLLEVQDHFSATRQFALDGLDRKRSGPFRFPFPACHFGVAARANLHPIGDHERRIETHAELADQGQVGLVLGLRIGGERLEKIARAAVRNGSQVRHQLIAGHADARVANRQPMFRFAALDHDFERAAISLAFIGQGDVAHLVECISRI